MPRKISFPRVRRRTTLTAGSGIDRASTGYPSGTAVRLTIDTQA